LAAGSRLAEQTCEVNVVGDGQAVEALVEGTATQDGRGEEKLCRAAVIAVRRGDRAAGPAAADRPATGTSGHPPPFSLDEALPRLGGDLGLFREMVGFFFADGLDLAREIQAAAAAGDATAVERKAHRLKGTVLYLGAEAASAAITGVETLGRARDLSGAAPAIRAMETELSRLAEALRPYR